MNADDLKARRADLLADTSLRGLEWCRAWAATVDGWLAGVFDAATGGDPARVSLIAVGGHGRGALAPGSDLDLLLLHDGKRRRVGDLANAIWYPIWDSGQALDHSVRTAKEVRAVMDSDVKVALGLLDARLIAGDPGLFGSVSERALETWRSKSSRWLPEIHEATRERHERFGDLAFLLEPDLKEARGGLRDMSLLRTVRRVAPALEGRLDGRLLRWAEGMLTSVRVELQRPRASSSNVLLLQDQDLVAGALELSDADQLMAAVADAARAIAWANDDGWRRVLDALSGSRRRSAGEELVLEPGIVLRHGEICLTDRADPAVDPSLALRVAAAAAELDRPVAATTLERLSKRSLAPEGVWPPPVLNALLRLLGAGRPAIEAIEALDHHGVWLRYLPEWEPVRNRPQRNAYHRFTVDRHLLEAVANAAERQSAVRRPDLLLLGTFLHDIGKGRGGDHTEIGIEVASALATRMGLPPADVEVIAAVVRHHLLLPDAATRRDLDDPATASAVAAAIADRDTLELLAVLTEADSLATGPAAWGRWKAGLVARLVEQVGAILEGRPPPDSGRAALSESERSLLAGGELSVRFEDGRLLVGAPDQAGLLATVAGVLTLSGVNVRSATTISDEGSAMALLRFEVVPAFDVLPDWEGFRAQLAAALDGDVDVEARLVEREERYSRFAVSVSARTPGVAVLVDADSSPAATIVEVRAPDRGPVLYRVTRALSRAGLTITCALVSTLGAEAIDVFYVTDGDGRRVEDDGRLDALRRAVLEAV